MKALVKRGADQGARDKHGRNVLHLIIKNGGKPGSFALCFCRDVSPDMFDWCQRVRTTP